MLKYGRANLNPAGSGNKELSFQALKLSTMHSQLSRFHSTRPTRPAYTDGLNYAHGILIGGRVFETHLSPGISSIRASFRRYLADIPKS